jgi:beta-galactosidase
MIASSGFLSETPQESSPAAARPKIQILDDFEMELIPGRWEGSVQRTTAHSARGRYALEARFDAKTNSLSAHLKNADWSSYDRFLFDAFNPEPLPAILSFDLYDAGGGGSGLDASRYDYYSGEGKIFLAPGWTHVDFVLKGLRTTSELRSIALDRIRGFTLTAERMRHPLTLYFDNFRLASGIGAGLSTPLKSPTDLQVVVEGREVEISQVEPPEKIPESETVKAARLQAQEQHQALGEAITSASHLGLDTVYSEAELTVAEIGLYLRPQLPWFNNDQQKRVLFNEVIQICRAERERLRHLITGELRLPRSDDTQVASPLVPPYPHLRGLSSEDGFFCGSDGRPLFIVSLHGPSGDLLRFFATPRQHIESYSVGGGSRWTVDESPVYEAFKKYPDTHRVGWDGWCGHLIRDLDSMGGKKENVVICLESPHTREAVERYIKDNVTTWTQNPELLYNILAYELQYICYCERSQQMFRAWLEQKHGTIVRLNDAWGTHYTDFQEIVAPPTKGARPLPGTNRAQWYDWACFNQERFTDYLVWVKSVVRRYDPTTPIAAGGSSSMLVGSNGTSGIDEEQIINRVDDVILHEGSGSTLGMDLQLALADQRKPLADPEMNLGQARYLLPHMLHGKSVIQIWQWPAQPPSEFPRSIDDSPPHSWSWSLYDISALFRAVLDARRLSREIAAFSSVPAQVAILYSKTSILQVPPEMLTWESTPYLRVLANAYEAARYLDTQVTFVSENQILSGKLNKFRVLIAPAVSHERAEVVQAIDRFIADGGTVLLLPPSFLSDEYNRPLDYLQQLGITIRRIEQPMADRSGEAEQSYDQTFRERVVDRSEPAVNLATKPADLFSHTPLELHAMGTRIEFNSSLPSQTLATFPDGKVALASFDHGKGRIYFSATSFPTRDLSSLLDRILDSAGVSRQVRVRSAEEKPIGNVETRFVDTPSGKLLYMVNFNNEPSRVRVEVDGRPQRKFYDLRTQEPSTSEAVHLPAGETLILRLDR